MESPGDLTLDDIADDLKWPLKVNGNGFILCASGKYSIIQGGPKTGMFLRSDKFAKTNDWKACNTSKVSEFCLE